MKKLLIFLAIGILIPVMAQASIWSWFTGLFNKEPVVGAIPITRVEQGGTGTSTASWTGYPYITSGVWGTSTPAGGAGASTTINGVEGPFTFATSTDRFIIATSSGTITFGFTEIDPVWSVDKTNYFTGSYINTNYAATNSLDNYLTITSAVTNYVSSTTIGNYPTLTYLQNNYYGTSSISTNYVSTSTLAGYGYLNNSNLYWLANGTSLYSSSTFTNIGIGTTSPAYTLDVEGNINAQNDIYGDNINYNEGMLDDPTITDGSGATINITSADCLIRSDSVWDNDKLYRKTVPATTSMAVTDNTMNWIIVSYNNGNPVYSATTTNAGINNSNVIPVARVYMSGTDIEYSMNYEYIGRSSAIRNFDKIMRVGANGGIERESGLMVTETATRVVNIGSGYAWFGLSRKTLGSIAQGVASSEIWYHSSGNWTFAATTTYNNANYDNGTNLVALTANRYAVNWIFRNVSADSIDIVLGEGDYTLAQAEASVVPDLPSQITGFYVLVGRIIVQQGASTATAIENISTSVFNQASVSIHNDLGGLQGGATGEYYHLTSASTTQLANINKWYSASSSLINLSVNWASSSQTLLNASSSNWDIAYSQRLQWDGGSTNLVATTGRTSLGLGTMALETASNYPTFTYANTNYAATSSLLSYLLSSASSSFAWRANNLSDLQNTSTARTNLGLVIGTNVQAYDANYATTGSPVITQQTLSIPLNNATSTGAEIQFGKGFNFTTLKAWGRCQSGSTTISLINRGSGSSATSVLSSFSLTTTFASTTAFGSSSIAAYDVLAASTTYAYGSNSNCSLNLDYTK